MNLLIIFSVLSGIIQLAAIFLWIRNKWYIGGKLPYFLILSVIMLLFVHQAFMVLDYFNAQGTGYPNPFFSIIIFIVSAFILGYIISTKPHDNIIRDLGIPESEIEQDGLGIEFYENFRIITEYTRDVIWTMNIGGEFNYVSPTVRKLLGFDPDELLMKRIEEFSSSETYQHCKSLMGEAIEDIESGKKIVGKHMEVEQVKKDGSTVWVEIIINSLHDNKERPIGFIGITRDINDRKLSEKKLLYRYKFGQLVSEISQKIISTKIVEIDEAIEYALRQIGTLEHIDRCYISLIDDDLNEISITHEWCSNGIKSQKKENQNIWMNLFPFFSKELKDFRIIQYADVNDMPSEAEKEKKIFQALNVKSIMMIPLVHANQMLGILCYESLSLIRQWDENIVLYSKMMADIISNALMRKAYIEVLKDSEERYKRLTDITFEGVAIHRDGDIIDCNESFLKLFGVEREEVIGKNPFKTYVDEKSYGIIVQRMQEEHSSPFIIPANPKDGKLVYLECEGKTLEIDDEHYQVLSVRDVTSRVDTENALERSEATLSGIFKAAPIGIGMIKDSKFAVLNDGVCKMLGYEKKELIGQNFRLIYETQEEYERVRKVINKDIEKNGIGSFETIFRRKSGENIHIYLSSSPIDPDDHSKGMIFTVMDITDQKRAARELEESRKRYQKLVDQAVDAIYVYDREGNIIDANQMADKMLGYTRDELLEMNVLNIDNKLLDSHIEKEIDGDLSKDKFISFESEHKRKDGSTFPVDIRLSVIELQGAQYILAFARDITVVKKSQLIQEVMYNISTAVSRSDNLNDLFGIIHKELDLLFDTSNIFIAMYDKDKDLMQLPYMKDTKEVFKSFPAGNTITSLVIKDKKSYFLKDQDIKDLENKKLIKRYGPAAKVWMGLPLLIEGEPIGVMVLQNYEDENAYDKNDLELLETIAPQISLSIGRKKNEEELKWIQKNLMEAQRVANLGSWERNITTGTTYWSDEFFRICGMTPGCVVPTAEMTIDIIHPEDRNKAQKVIEDTIRTGEPYNIETRIVLPDDSIRYVLFQGEVIYDEQKEPEKLVGSFLDITNRVLTERALKESEEKYRNLAESAPYGIVVHSDYKVIYANHEAAKILEADSPDAFMGRNVMEILHDDYKDIVIERIEKVYTSNVNLESIEEKFYTFNKKLIDVDVSATSINFNGKPAAQVIFRDITKQKQDQEEIRKLSRAVEKSPASVSITDKDGVIVYVNPQFVEMTGYTREEILGKTHSVLKSGKHSEKFHKGLWESILSGKVWRGEICNKKKNGDFFWAEESISSLKSEKGDITHFIAIWQDVSERKKLQEEQIRAKEKAEDLNKIKSNFLATMSHELRTPLNGILGFAEILYDIIEDEEQKEMAEIINQSGKRLLETLNSILNLSALESNQLLFTSKETDTKDIIMDVRNLYVANANKKQIYLVTEFKTPYTVIKTDERFIRQICNNLLNNAIKYTQKGGVIIEVDEDDRNGRHWLRIRFIDTGIGISEENLKLVFDEFRQVSEGYNREFEGSGLGLNICERYVHAMDGEISVESQVGIGSTFTVRLPFDDSPRLKEKNYNKKETESSVLNKIPEHEKPNILFVEDEKSNQQYVKHLLVKMDYNVDLAETGQKAIKLSKDNHYNIILMDINLGKDMSGIMAMEEIKKINSCLDVPIVAVTANAMKDQREEFLSKGFDYYISKPFSKEKLSNLINQIMDNNK
jgi:PAS domain S-box-containing protein